MISRLFRPLWWLPVVVLGFLFIRLAGAETLPAPQYWITDGTVSAVARSQSLVYLGGNFSFIGPNTGHGVTINVGTGTPNSRDPRIESTSGAVFAVVADGNGGWFVGGRFERVGDTDRTNLVHIRQDKTVDTTFTPDLDGPVRALALSSDGATLYIGGEFTTVDGSARNRLAAFTTANGMLTDWAPNTNATVRVLQLSSDDSTVYAGGDFSQINGASRVGLAAINASDGTLAAWSADTNGQVHALALDSTETRLYVGGSFTQISGVARNRIAAVQVSDGTVDGAFDPDANGTVRAIAIDDNDERLFFGGDFTQVSGQAQAYLAKITLADNLLDSGWDPVLTHPDLPVTVNALLVSDINNRLFIGGQFAAVQPGGNAAVSPRLNFAVLDMTSTNGIALQSHTNGPVHTFAFAVTTGDDGSIAELFVGGAMTSVGGQQRQRLASVSATSGIPTNWAPQVASTNDTVDDSNWSVDALVVSSTGTTLYAAGNFAEIDGQPRSGLAKLDAIDVSAPLLPWNPSVDDGQVRALAIANPGGNVQSLAVDPHDGQHILAGTSKGLYESRDGALNWSEVTLPEPRADIRSVVFDPQRPGIVYVGAMTYGVWKTTDGGTTWTAVNNGLEAITTEDGDTVINVRSIAVHPDNPDILYLGSDYRFTRNRVDGQEQLVSTGGIFKSTDGGQNWDDVMDVDRLNCLLDGVETACVLDDVLTVAIDPNDPDTVYFGTALGVVRTRNGGQLWVPATAGLAEGPVNAIVVSRDRAPLEPDDPPETIKPSLVYCIVGRFAFKSVNGGDQWDTARAGLPNDGTVAMAIDPNDPDTLYVGTATVGVFKTTSAAEPPTANAFAWEARNQGITAKRINTIAIDPNDSSRVFAGSDSGIIYVTGDGGDTWTEQHEGVPNDILYLGGTFTRIAGAPRNYLAALDTTTDPVSFVTDWDPGADGPVNALRLNGKQDLLYAGGAFTTLGGTPRARFAALDTTTGQVTSLDLSIDDGAVNTLALTADEQQIYAGGTFTTVAGQPRSKLARFDRSGTLQPWRADIVGGEVYDLILSTTETAIIVAGDFTGINADNRRFLAALYTDRDTDNVTLWDPSPDVAFFSNGTFAAQHSDESFSLFIGGGYTRISNRPVSGFSVYTFTRPTVSAEPVSGAFNTPQDIRLQCSDNSLSGCEDIFYTTYPARFDDTTGSLECTLDSAAATFIAYTTGETIPVTETTCLSFYAVDNEGSRSVDVTEKYILDFTGPTVTASLPDGTYRYTQVIRLTCDDGNPAEDTAISECAQVFYTTDGSTPTFRVNVTGNRVTFEPTGSTNNYDPSKGVPVFIDTTLRFVAVDSAGNASAIEQRHYQIERGQGAAAATPLWVLLLSLFAALARRRESGYSGR